VHPLKNPTLSEVYNQSKKGLWQQRLRQQQQHRLEGIIKMNHRPTMTVALTFLFLKVVLLLANDCDGFVIGF
jgi:hypothetical protein